MRGTHLVFKVACRVLTPPAVCRSGTSWTCCHSHARAAPGTTPTASGASPRRSDRSPRTAALLSCLLVDHPSGSVRLNQTDVQKQLVWSTTPEGQHTSGTVLDGIGSAVQELRELPLARASTIVTAPSTWQVRASGTLRGLLPFLFWKNLALVLPSGKRA